MEKITNVRVHKSDQQRKDYILALETKKRLYLQNTDWTQLDDVKIKNQKQVDEWRQHLRNFKVGDNPTEEVEKRLDDIIDAKPEIQFDSNANSSGRAKTEILENKVKILEKEVFRLNKEFGESKFTDTTVEYKDEVEYVSKEKAYEIIYENFIYYKNKILMENGILEYDLTKLLLEEAVDKKFSNVESESLTLLDESTAGEDLDEIISRCKNYFSKINEIYVGLKKEEASIYNMSTEEVNKWFVTNGYRYRSKDGF